MTIASSSPVNGDKARRVCLSFDRFGSAAERPIAALAILLISLSRSCELRCVYACVGGRNDGYRWLLLLGSAAATQERPFGAVSVCLRMLFIAIVFLSLGFCVCVVFYRSFASRLMLSQLASVWRVFSCVCVMRACLDSGLLEFLTSA